MRAEAISWMLRLYMDRDTNGPGNAAIFERKCQFMTWRLLRV